MNILRQVSMILAKGQLTTPAQAADVRQRWRDVPSKLALSVADGKYDQGAALISTVQTIPLPNAYTAGQRLYCAFSVGGSDPVKITVVSPDHGASVYLLKGSNDAVNGYRTRPLVWVGTVTSITAVNAGAATLIPLDWFMFELPDLTLAASYRIGQLALGVSA
jgi:hypothetical protein